MTDFQPILDLISQKKLDEALALLQPVLEADPDNAEAWHCQGCLQQTRGDNQWAIECYKKAFTINHDHTRALYNYGTLLRRNPALELATASRKAFKHVKKLIPNAAIPYTVYMGFPHYGSSEPRFEESLTELMAATKPEYGLDLMQCRCEGSRITSNRNRLAADARAKGATHIFFVDSDMDFPPDALLRLLAHDKDIVGATTCKRGDEDGIPIGQALGVGDANGVKEIKTGCGLIEMVAMGCCFMLIKMEVFDKIKLPAFYEPPNYDIEDAWGEDITFCKIARENGYQIWMDFDLSTQLGHWGKKRYHIKPKKEPISALIYPAQL